MQDIRHTKCEVMMGMDEVPLYDAGMQAGIVEGSRLTNFLNEIYSIGHL